MPAIPLLAMLLVAASAGIAGAGTPKPPAAVTRALLQKSDLPAGWFKDHPDPASDSASAKVPTVRTIATCLKIHVPSVQHPSPEAEVQWDSLSGGQIGTQQTNVIRTFSNSITVGSRGDATAFAALRRAGAADCVRQFVAAAIHKEAGASGPTVTELTTTAFDPGPYVLDHAVGFRVAATVTGPGPAGTTTATLTVNLVYAARGRYIVSFADSADSAAGAPLDPAVEQHALTAVAARVAKLPGA